MVLKIVSPMTRWSNLSFSPTIQTTSPASKGCVRGGVHGGGAVAFDADDEAGGFITDLGFPDDGASHEWCVGLNGGNCSKLTSGDAVVQVHVSVFSTVFDKLTEDVNFFVRGGHDDVVEKDTGVLPHRECLCVLLPG